MKTCIPLLIALTTAPASASAQKIGPQVETDPLKVIYRVAGISDSGGNAQTGTASVILCSNYQTAPEQLTFLVTSRDGATIANIKYTINARATFSIATRDTKYFFESSNWNLGAASQAMVIIGSTTTNISCTAMVVDAAATGLDGIDLHMQRLSPHPGTVE